MLRFRNNFLIVMLCATLSACGFVDLRPINYSVEPDITDSVLPDSYSPVIVRFDTEMDKNDAEKIFQVNSGSAVVRGDFSWIGRDLYFTPVSGWTAGVRYTLSLAGIIRSVDGRDLKLEKFVSFYAINKNEPPILEKYFPLNGASVGTGDVVLELQFSRAMDRLSVESSLTVEGFGNKTFEWSENDKILKVAAEKSLSPWIACRWNLKDTARSSEGVPLPKSYSAYFTTNLDQILPHVTNVYPVLYSDGSWYPTGKSIETGLSPNQAVAVEFSKPMGENVLRSVRFEPSLTGRTELLSENSIVYIFTKDPEPETMYTLIVSADTRDSEGLKIGSDHRVFFTPDIPFLSVSSFHAGGGSLTEDIFSNIQLPARADPGTGEFFFIVCFSLPFSTEEKQNSIQKIALAPVFPRTLSPVALQDVHWISDDRLYMKWEGLKAGDREVPHYYKLTFPGGKSGITTGTGMYMKEDITIYLEAVNEK